MSENIIIALIAMFGTAMGTFWGIYKSTKLTGYRIEQLEKKMDKHNSFIERLSKVEIILNERGGRK